MKDYVIRYNAMIKNMWGKKQTRGRRKLENLCKNVNSDYL